MAAPITSLMNFGMAPQLAGLLGNTVTALTCTGTSAGTAASVTSRVVRLVPASSQTGAIIRVDPVTGLGAPGDVFFFSNAESTTAVVYPPTGATITGAASISIAQNKNAIVWVVSSTLLYHVILA